MLVNPKLSSEDENRKRTSCAEKRRKENKKMEKHSKGEILGSLLKAELSAAETYQHLLEKASEDPGVSALKRIHEDHQESAQALVNQLTDLGIRPARETGTWSVVAVVAEMGVHPLSDPMAIKALKEGEEQGLEGYRNALLSGTLTRDQKSLISDHLLPRVNRNLSRLNKLLEAA